MTETTDTRTRYPTCSAWAQAKLAAFPDPGRPAARAALLALAADADRSLHDPGGYQGTDPLTVVDLTAIRIAVVMSALEYLVGHGLAEVSTDGRRYRLPAVLLAVDDRGRPASMTALPAVDFDEVRARAWCERQLNDDIEVLGGPWVPAQDGSGGEFLVAAVEVVDLANDDDLFGEQVDVSLAISCDSEGVMDGAFVFVSPGDYRGGPYWRLASLHQEHRSLTGDSQAEGQAAGLAILTAVAAAARQILGDARVAFGGPA